MMERKKKSNRINNELNGAIDQNLWNPNIHFWFYHKKREEKMGLVPSQTSTNNAYIATILGRRIQFNSEKNCKKDASRGWIRYVRTNATSIRTYAIPWSMEVPVFTITKSKHYSLIFLTTEIPNPNNLKARPSLLSIDQQRREGECINKECR